jgi:hypothetical protein
VKHRKHYIGSTNNLDIGELRRMVDDAVEIKSSSFKRNVVAHKRAWTMKRGLNILTSEYTTFYKSTYEGFPCYFMKYNHINYVFRGEE